ncbi:hypothetical protein GCM10028773_34250 [Spirosoma koreense]
MYSLKENRHIELAGKFDGAFFQLYGQCPLLNHLLKAITQNLMNVKGTSNHLSSQLRIFIVRFNHLAPPFIYKTPMYTIK